MRNFQLFKNSIILVCGHTYMSMNVGAPRIHMVHTRDMQAKHLNT